MDGYRGISTSLQAENNLHATLFTIRLVEEFVAANDRWPNSWDELEDFPVEGELWANYEWPAASTDIRERVFIDFQPDLREIVEQDPMTFTAIRPVGPRYEYRRYDFVASLQALRPPVGSRRRRVALPGCLPLR